MLCRGNSPLVERGDFENAKRAVPHQGLGVADGAAQALHRLGTGVQDAFVVVDRAHRTGARRRAGAELFGHHHVQRQEQLAVVASGQTHDLARGVGQVFFAIGGADVVALGVEKGVGHAATDGQLVQLGHQVLEQLQLGRHLGAADNAYDWPLGMAQGLVQGFQFAAHGLARIGRQQVGQPLGGGVCAVGRREGVIDI